MTDASRPELVRSSAFQLERDDTDDGRTLRGHGAVFNEWTVIDSWEGRFRERIAPGAFRKTLQENGANVRLQFDHGQHPLIGSLPIGSIRKLKEDGQGLFVEARLSNNWLIEPVRDAIAEGSIDGMSFRFSVIGEKWDKEDTDLPERTITEVRLVELGPVVFPAYPGTDVGVRSLELARGLMAADDDTRREIAGILLSTDTPEGAADGTPAEAVEVTEPADGHSRSDDEAPAPSPTYIPAQRPVMTRERLDADLALVRARAAAASAKEAQGTWN
jgi:HK97 family phage prohead protease